MPYFSRDGFSIHHETHGNGPPVVLLHGICVSFAGNFGAYGWIERLCGQGLQVVGMDLRGHGQSDKPHDPSAYGTTHLANDVIALLDHLGLHSVSLMGYSLGSVIALHLLHTHPDRFTRGVLIATGDGLLGLSPYSQAEVAPKLAHALDRPDYPVDLPRHVATYWNFATKVGGDRLAAAAAARAHYPPCTPAEIRHVHCPVLVVSGEQDPVLGTGPRLAQALPHGRYLEIPGADHFNLTLNEQAQKAVATFLCEREDQGATARS
jgi:pimeloyl-ACP methyl ester carboxylesterase